MKLCFIINSVLLGSEFFCALSTSCTKDQYTCTDAECIPLWWRCDGEADCENSSDEIYCNSTSCDPIKEFRCDHGQCIPKQLVCDGDDDCITGFDERNCNSECEEFFCDIPTKCMSWSKVCDGVSDCKDLTDEGGMCTDACTGERGGCSQVCHKTPQGSKCSCNKEYILSEDGVTCDDGNKCNIPGTCSQFCNNTEGGFTCYCAEGYYLNLFGKCKAVGGPATLVYILPDQIRGIDLVTDVEHIYVDTANRDMRGMGYDASQGILFWSDWEKKTINKHVLDTNERDVLLNTRERPKLVRWDWINKNLYYTDDESSIIACNQNGKYCSTVIFRVAGDVRGIDIAPNTNLMFWTVRGTMLNEQNGKVERAELDGSHRMVIVNDRIVWPSAVIVDHVMERIFWVDSRLNVMESTDFNGLKRRVVVPNGMFSPVSMAIFEDFVYWSDWGTDTIIRCDKYGRSNCIKIHSTNVKSEDIMIVHKVHQPKGQNRCLNSGCPQLCLPTRTGFVCKCNDNKTFLNGSCEIKPTESPDVKPVCPKNVCPDIARCEAMGEIFICRCPEGYSGARCEDQTPSIQYFIRIPNYILAIFVLLGIALVALILWALLICLNRSSSQSPKRETSKHLRAKSDTLPSSLRENVESFQVRIEETSLNNGTC